MTFPTKTLGLAGVATILGLTAAVAQDPNAGAVNARQGQMQIMTLNIGILGGMARGNIEYDAEMAQTAADNLVAVSQIAQDFNWPAGSDNASMEGTRALPAIWEDYDGFLDHYADFGEATLALQAVAGDGLDAMRPAIGPVGGTCGACHDDYRQTR